MTPLLTPAVCVWSRSGVVPSATAMSTLEASLPGECPRLACFAGVDLPSTWERGPVAAGPTEALAFAAARWPGRPVLLVWVEAIVPATAYRRLVAAATARPDLDVISTATSAIAALDPLPACELTPGQRDAHCWRHGDPRPLPCRAWSPALSWWRTDAAGRIDGLAANPLPDSVQGAIVSAAHVAAPRLPEGDEPVPPAIAALRARAPVADLGTSMPGLDGKPVVLHIVHGWGGGTWRFVADLQAADTARHHLALVAHGDWTKKRHGERLALYERLDGEPLADWTLGAPIAATATACAEYRAILDHVLGRWSIGAVLVSSLVGHSLDVLRTGLPTAVCTHDYYPLWPRLHARFGDPDAVFDDSALVATLRSPEPLPFASREPDEWRRLRQDYLDALAAADARLVAPTDATRRNQIALAPALAERHWSVIPHGQPPLAAVAVACEAAAAGSLRVLVPGRIQGDKGENLLAELVPALPDGIELILLGCGAGGQRFLGARNVHLLRDYSLGELPHLVARIRPDLALLPSTVPETWSYTLSEMWQLGVPVLAGDLGAYRERISDGENGLLVAPDARSVLAKLVELAGDPTARTALSELHPPALADLDAMARRWRDALPAAMPGSAPPAPVSPESCELLASRARRHALDEAIAGLETSLAMQRDELDRRADWALELERQLGAERSRVAALAAVAEPSPAAVAEPKLQTEIGRLQRRIDELQQETHRAHAHYEADTVDLVRQRDVALCQRDSAQRQVQALLASSSWRLTRPLRVARRALSGLGAEVGYRWRRLRVLVTRGLTSLRVRGLRHTLMRVRQVLAPSAGAGHAVAADAAAAARGLPESDAPRASIIVPVFNQIEFTLACLRSLAASGDATEFEVIVVDDGSSDATAQVLPEMPGLRYHRNPRNLGFVGACNAGAALARSEYLVFLNNDTTVRPGWLDALLSTFKTHPDTGLAGSKLIYPDGRLQEAGGIVFYDGSGWNFGRFEDPDHPRYAFVREVDYCSGAALAIAKTLFDAVGGFDACYAPAYYEDTDLAMKVRDRGLRVRYQPSSEVVHHEGVTAGTDTGQGVKAYQAVNQKTFLQRWSTRLRADHAPPGTPAVRAAQWRCRDRVLIIDACTPTPDRDSGSLRMVNLMRLLIEEGCAVSFFADNHAHDGAYTRTLQQLGVEVWHQPWLGNVARWFAEHGHGFDTVILSRHYVASSYLPLLRQFAAQAKIVFDTVDLHYLREQREAELAGSAIMARNARATRDKELRLIREADLTLVVSPMERELLAQEAPNARVEVLSNVHAVPGCRRGFDDRRDLVFVGGFRHPPNVDAMRWFVGEALPRVREQLPDLRVHIIGSEAPEAIQRLADAPGVEFHGYVADLDAYMDGCRIAIAPLRYGAGVKGKVNLSMAHGQPVVATTCAIEGMFLHPGEDVLTADTSEDFAAAIVRLYDDRALWEQLSARGLDNVRRHFSFDAARAALRRVLERVPRNDPSRSSVGSDPAR